MTRREANSLQAADQRSAKARIATAGVTPVKLKELLAEHCPSAHASFAIDDVIHRPGDIWLRRHRSGLRCEGASQLERDR